MKSKIMSVYWVNKDTKYEINAMRSGMSVLSLRKKKEKKYLH